MKKKLSKLRKSQWVWMPHAAHFICRDRCKFHLATYIGKYIVSTVGEMPHNDMSRKYRVKGSVETDEWQEIGHARLYETMVFKACAVDNKCCPFRIDVSNEMDFEGYVDAGAATEGHMRLCEKWAKK